MAEDEKTLEQELEEQYDAQTTEPAETTETCRACRACGTHRSGGTRRT